jgi:peptidoglycan biosynthesis protein MviN/MurJ (putative lipid II flippase)
MLGLLIVLVIVGTIVWVGVDSGQRDFSQGKYWHSPLGWIISCIVLWIVYFPLYLFCAQKGTQTTSRANAGRLD